MPCVCVDSSLLPEDGGGDPTREAVIAKSSVNRGHPVGRCLKSHTHYSIKMWTVYCGNFLAALIV